MISDDYDLLLAGAKHFQHVIILFEWKKKKDKEKTKEKKNETNESNIDVI